MQFVFRGHMTFPFSVMSAPLTYDAPTLGQMIDNVMSDLRDPEGRSFGTDEIRNLIRLAFNEVTGIYPKESVDYLALEADTTHYALLIKDPWRVEILDANGYPKVVAANVNDEGPYYGWDYYADTLRLPARMAFDATTETLRVYGYGDRYMPEDDADVCDVDAEADAAIRTFAVLNGYTRLVSSRALFTQWQAAPGNTDVTVNQLSSIADIFNRQWEAMRGRMKLHRRQP